MSTVQEQAMAIVLKHAHQMAVELIEAVAIPALEQAVKATANPVDDMVLAALKEPLKKALLDLITKV